ncbi:MAG: ribbon-helix-helix protein, CopG family [Planctomycetes bacterium]|nr:ribbon-helix-helix protein, CopG family [Planctomycetota bacterium]
MKRTTVLISPEQLLALERVARSKGISRSQALRDAIARYAAEGASRRGRRPGFVGCGASGYHGSLGRDAKRLLERATGRRGWK